VRKQVRIEEKEKELLKSLENDNLQSNKEELLQNSNNDNQYIIS